MISGESFDATITLAGLKQRLGYGGRATIEAGYSLSLHAPTVYEIFKSVLRYPKTQGITNEIAAQNLTREIRLTK